MKLLFVGDVMLGRLVNEALKQRPAAYPWGDTLTVLSGADLRICNLECVISDRGRPWSLTPKAFHFRTDAKNAAVLKAAGIDMVSLANNHSLDFEDEGLLQMLKILSDKGIAFCGAGRDMAQARGAAWKPEAKKVAMIAFTDNEPGWEAAGNRPGIYYVPVDLKDPRARSLLEEVARAKQSADVLVVSAHWGPNWGYDPPPEHPIFAHALIDAGADIIFGHSGHVFRGVEIYRGRPIIYCAGNFIDDYAVDEVERNDQSFIFVVEEGELGLKRLQLYPTVIAGHQARLAFGREQRQIAQKMQRLCEALGTVSLWRPRHGFLEIANSRSNAKNS